MKHKSFNRTLATLLSVMLMVGLLPTTVFAAENYNIIVSGTQLTSDNASDVLGDGTVSYDHETKTLTLDNADLKGGILISQENAVNISIQGENKITSDNYGIAKNAYPTDPTTPGGLCVSGPGSLVVTAQTNGIEAVSYTHLDVYKRQTKTSDPEGTSWIRGRGDGGGFCVVASDPCDGNVGRHGKDGFYPAGGWVPAGNRLFAPAGPDHPASSYRL